MVSWADNVGDAGVEIELEALALVEVAHLLQTFLVHKVSIIIGFLSYIFNAI